MTIVVLLVAMPGAYFLAQNLGGNFATAEVNLLLQGSTSVLNRASELYQEQRTEARRVAFTGGVAGAMRAVQVETLFPILESLAAAGDLDSIIVTDTAGVEIAGVLRVETGESVDYSLGTETDLSDEILIQQVMRGDTDVSSGLFQTPEGMMLYTAVPVNAGEERVGLALVGQFLEQVVSDLRASALADVTLYGADGMLLETTFPVTDATLPALRLDRVLLEQIMTTETAVQTSLTLDQTQYRSVYTPLSFGQNTIAVLSTSLPDSVSYVTSAGRQIVSLLAAALVGAVVIAAFTGISITTGRVNRVTATAQQLATGKADSRTGMQAVDEVGAVGAALDHYAGYVQQREDKFQTLLRRQRRERNYLMAVLESMPDGVLVQDKEGKIIVMNDMARQLVGSEEVYESAHIPELASLLTSEPGEALVPGMYVLGDPGRVEIDGKMLTAQAAAVMSLAQKRIGTVLIVRDITGEVQEEQARESLLSQLSQDIQQPLAGLAQQHALHGSPPVSDFAREISRHAAALQKMIVDMRELTRYNPQTAQRRQRAIAAETLIWAITNDWRQIAGAASLEMQIAIHKKGLFILGDESRLRWSLGNIVDNAIKYTSPGGAISLEIRDVVDNMLHLRVRDNGTGISDEDMDNLFMPFYRGTPITEDGQIIRVPGMGQGLPLTKQVIEAHGGKIKVKSKPGVGTAVYIALPLTSGTAYTLPLISQSLDDTMEGATVQLPQDVELE